MGCKPFYIATEHFGVTYHGKRRRPDITETSPDQKGYGQQ
jgi:hypothetical protein